MTQDYEHQHDHHNDNGHDHEHHHDHNHHHQHAEPGAPVIHVDTHETSIIASFQFHLDKPKAQAQEAIDGMLSNIGDWVIAQDGIIGHIKAIVRLSDEGYQVSLTEDELIRRPISNERASVEGVAIVFGVTPEALENRVKEAVGACIGQ